jgi:transposase-like protein
MTAIDFCKYCHSPNIIKKGVYDGIQYYYCKDCKHKFTEKNTWPRMKHDKDLVNYVLTYYFNGMSLRNICSTIEDLRYTDISRMTCWRWIVKYSKLAHNYVKDMKPIVGDTWIADETVVKVGGRNLYFWDIIDEDTRYLLASHLSTTRSVRDATVLFRDAYEHAGKKPSIVITDRYGAYPRAFKKVFRTIYSDSPVHYESEGFTFQWNTNLIERFHGTLKQRTKVMRGFKNKRTANTILHGFVIHYNFMLEHSSLGDIAPAQRAGIGEGIDNWNDLLNRAYGHTDDNSFVFWSDMNDKINGGVWNV